MKKNYKLKFLSESILLEESGLPFMNTAIIVSVTLFMAIFILWANQVMMEERVDISGVVSVLIHNGDQAEIIGYATTQNVNLIRTDSVVYVDIPGVTGRKSLDGKVSEIKTEPVYDTSNKAYYEVVIRLEVDEYMRDELNGSLLSGMESQLKIVTGTRTLLQYFLGSLYDTGLDVFSD